ncbi:hypothetical protein [uncultured Chryseobacterium sp.]|uniref:hypothetical protein n=1 Tax=uncultured Chryseobacterium sp. TaxID=259322 RepID=UPI0025F3D8BF|nr:hypothetical protein [uncultured Chryseobacterium sp.]
MRFVVKPEANKTDKLKHQDTINALNVIASTKNKDLISDVIYRDSYQDIDEIRSRVEDQLAITYLNKCAYCERLEKADIEHYRPKKSVKGEIHDGYYWLCYEWTNLLPSCVKCNRDGAKLTHFPILGTRVLAPKLLRGRRIDLNCNKAFNKPLIDEIPYLLHPEIDNPQLFFEFELDPSGEGIRLKGIDADGRGVKTIEICKLNRQELRLHRQREVMDPFVESIEAIFAKRTINEIDDNKLVTEITNQLDVLKRNASKVKKSHTLLRKYIIKDEKSFKSIVLPFLDKSIRPILLAAYRNWAK